MKLVLKLGFIIFFFTDLYTIGDEYVDFFSTEEDLLQSCWNGS